jgi:hypothetical protein
MNEVRVDEQIGQARIIRRRPIDDERHVDPNRDTPRLGACLEGGGADPAGLVGAAPSGCRRQNDDADDRRRGEVTADVETVVRGTEGSLRGTDHSRIQKRIDEALVAGQVLTAPMKTDGAHQRSATGWFGTGR